MPIPMKDDGRPKILLTKEEVYKKYSKGYRLKRKKKRKKIFLLLLLLIILILLYLFYNNDFNYLIKSGIFDYYFYYLKNYLRNIFYY